MGRQKGDAARSKARPSSSSLAASLLPAGATAVGFGGYVGSSSIPTASSSDASLIIDIDAELAQQLKRLSRKDPTTKLKALTTLSTLLKDKSAKDVLPAIPQWAFEYKKLLMDYNRDVRRATHDTMATLVTTVGRDLAPHVKSLMGPWWFSQFDPVYEVSQVAKRSLEAAFPAQEKRLDALMLCTDEVFMYLGDNLKLTPQSMSDKAVALDELQEMHQQVISSSLLALATFLDILTSEKQGSENTNSEQKKALKARTAAISHAEKLLSVHKYFLVFLNSHSSAIRSAAYSLVGSCVKNISHALTEANIKTLAPVILGALQEKDPTCHSSMWEALLLFSRKFPESWTTLNVHKVLVNPFWNFLRNGCFGSQQVSYPTLVLFLNCVPSKAITVDKFFLEFFRNFWAGKVHSQSSNADLSAFFKSYRECFIWTLQSAQRYCGVEAIDKFRCTIVDEVLLKLMWHDYLLVPSSEDKLKKYDKYQVDNVQEFGKCIIEILSGLFSLEPNSLSVFCHTFEENCLEAFQQSENVENHENLDKIIRFLQLVDLNSVRKGDSWPLSYLVGPMMSKLFQIVQTSDSSDIVKFMVVAVSMFGPRKIVEEITWEQNVSACLPEKNRDLSLNQFLQLFKDVFVPWCFKTDSSSTLTRLDFLFALLDAECFSDQCESIILHATGNKDSNFTYVLALVMEKMREQSTRMKLQLNLSHHELLDSTAVSVSRSLPPLGSSDARFICAALGGVTEEDQTYFVSENASISIFEEIFLKLRSFIGSSDFTWVKGANELLNSEEEITITGCESSTRAIEIASFAMEVLNGSFFRLKTLALLPQVLAALFVIDWEHNSLEVLCEGLDDVAHAKLMDRFHFCKSVHSFRGKINKLLKTFNLDCRRKLSSILVQTIRCVVFNEDTLDIETVSSLGCIYFMDVVDNLCEGPVEEQTLLDELLNTGDSWPLWVTPDIKDAQRSATLKNESSASGDHRVAAFVDKIISKVGIARVMTSHCHHRAWLATEMLCTWKWPGGSVLTSFLPSFIQYTTGQDSVSSDDLLDTVVNALIDGALVEGLNSEMRSLSINLVPPESIEQVFLRALVSLLSTLFEDNIWGRNKALKIFNLLVDRLFVGEAVNSNCLKILPVVMSVLIGPLFGDEVNDASKRDDIHDVIERWLQRTLSFPPLNTWLSGQDMEDWYHLVVSCYPLKRMKLFKPQRHITIVERSLLLELLRKQRLASTSATVNELSVVQTLLSKLTVVTVGYCWNDFNQDDWEYILYKSRYWIESAVVLMEEVAEAVNDTITHGPTSDIPEKLQVTLLGLDSNSSALKLAKHALITFSMFYALIAQDTVETETKTKTKTENEIENDQHPLRSEKWDPVKDKILQGVLRLFFSTGAAEAIAGSYSLMAGSVVASSRLGESEFWELVSSSAAESSSHARERAMKSFDLWGLSKGAVSSLYAILFSSKPVALMQYAAYVILSSEPVADSAFFTQETASFLNESEIDDKDPISSSLDSKIQLREEISVFLEKSPFEIIELDLVAPDRVHVFVTWSLISHLLASPSSTTKEKLIQHIKDSCNPMILDCIFQHIPLELCAASVKKKLSQLPPGISEFAQSATRAITNNSVLFAVESLWPIGPDRMTSFTGAMYGLMLKTLPAYVREWFNDVRDHTSSSAIESFTRTWCSPPLIADELSQIKKADLSDENFSVSVSKSANEVVATCTKDESNMDLVVRLPASYPLRPVDVECTRSLGISEVKQRKWLLSMMSFVRNQNGALAEAIRIWKNNFDKEFEGVEECPICYSVIHTSNHSLPRRACRTCKHKFHSACLYKWFLTSNKSNCPLCQSPF
ncbi:E3 ubiquitin-protein ligase listerin-like [Bidens hawaiensis]|uniref:E3 ubiquitin-protein ligase listerin-like n=1 Tax=Bidens hawaiensis TaxID=980011 RepID=UPI00404A3FB5